MPVHEGLDRASSTKRWTPQLLFLGSCVCSKIGFLSIDFVLANFHDTRQTKQRTASKEIILVISSQPWSNDNA